jgi:hypothetical protein
MLIQARRLLSGEYRERLVRHEAGHLLVAYLLGLPVRGYRADDSVLNAVQLVAPPPTEAGRLGLDEVDRLSAVSLAGVVAEAIRFGDGAGGFADLAQLQGRGPQPRMADAQRTCHPKRCRGA